MKATLSVKRCSACGRDHEGMQPTRMPFPVTIAGEAYTHSFPCPTNDRTVYVRDEP